MVEWGTSLHFEQVCVSMCLCVCVCWAGNILHFRVALKILKFFGLLNISNYGFCSFSHQIILNTDDESTLCAYLVAWCMSC